MDKHITILSKWCRICGDQASSFNFNGLSCVSSKAFFRSAVFKNNLKCKNRNNCEINRTSRKNCKKCRFDKCLAIGMKKELVSTKRITPSNKPNTFVMPIDRISLFSNEKTLNLKMYELSRLGEVFSAVAAFPNESSWQIVAQVNNVSQLVNLSAANIKHIIRFCKSMREFNCLTQDQQVSALKCVVPEIHQIRAAFIYDTETRGWAALEHSDCDKRAVFVKMDFFKSWTNVEKYNFFSNFIMDFHREMENDPAIRDLILVQSVFKHRPEMGPNVEFVQYHNVVLHYLLPRYLEHKYLDKRRAAQKYTSLMGLLAKMDITTSATREFYASPHITIQAAPVLREIYNLQQT